MTKKNKLSKTAIKESFKRTDIDPKSGPIKVLAELSADYYTQRAYETIGLLKSDHLPRNCEPTEGKYQLVKEALLMLHLAEIRLHSELLELGLVIDVPVKKSREPRINAERSVNPLAAKQIFNNLKNKITESLNSGVK